MWRLAVTRTLIEHTLKTLFVAQRIRTDAIFCQEQWPIEDIVENVDFVVFCCLQDKIFEYIKIGSLIELQIFTVFHIRTELRRTFLAQTLAWVLRFDFAYIAIARRVLVDGNILPRKSTLEEVDYDVTEGCKVVASGEF